MRGDDAGVVGGVGLTLTAGDDLAVGDDRTRAGVGANARLEHLRFPRQLAGPGIDRVDAVVGAGVDERVAPHRHVPVGAAVDAVGVLAAVLPLQITGPRVHRHDDVAGIRDVHRAVVDERRRLLRAAADDAARPHHLEPRHVVAVDLVQRAVAPAVERAPPRQPVVGTRLPQHFVGHRRERLLLGLRGHAQTGDGDEKESEQDVEALHGDSFSTRLPWRRTDDDRAWQSDAPFYPRGRAGRCRWRCRCSRTSDGTSLEISTKISRLFHERRKLDRRQIAGRL